jgi:hypothetical protein
MVALAFASWASALARRACARSCLHADVCQVVLCVCVGGGGRAGAHAVQARQLAQVGRSRHTQPGRGSVAAATPLVCGPPVATSSSSWAARTSPTPRRTPAAAPQQPGGDRQRARANASQLPRQLLDNIGRGRVPRMPACTHEHCSFKHNSTPSSNAASARVKRPRTSDPGCVRRMCGAG